MNAAKIHLASCYAHSGPILDTGCHYRPTIKITRPKMCLGSSKMCRITTRHILDEQMENGQPDENKKQAKLLNCLQLGLFWILGLRAGTKPRYFWQIATCLALTSTWHELEFSRRILSPLPTDKIFFTSQKSGMPNVQESANNVYKNKKTSDLLNLMVWVRVDLKQPTTKRPKGCLKLSIYGLKITPTAKKVKEPADPLLFYSKKVHLIEPT